MFVASFMEIDRAVFPPALYPERQTCIQTYIHFVKPLPYFLHTIYSENVIKQQFTNVYAYLNSKLLFLERWKCYCWPHFDKISVRVKNLKKAIQIWKFEFPVIAHLYWPNWCLLGIWRKSIVYFFSSAENMFSLLADIL